VSPAQAITAEELDTLLAELVPIGRDAQGATTRLAWSAQDEQARQWFARRAADVGHAVERDAAGNLWASPPGRQPPWWGVGSHLDSVVRGGRYDGALGVAVGFAVAARMPVAVLAFADEEGARFNTPTFGSRALAGRLLLDGLLQRVDAGGETLGQALRAAGLDPDALADAQARLPRLRGFLELHIDQTRALAVAGLPAAVVSGLAARMRVQARLTGRADHAGTTRGSERRDALLAAARLIVDAEQLAAQEGEMVFTAARIEVEPNAASTVPERVRLWLDARASDPQRVTRWREQLDGFAAALAARSGVEITLATASWSPGIEFSAAVCKALSRAIAEQTHDGELADRGLLCWAGHDAGILAEQLPAGMVLVRNASGISHAPEEDVSLSDAAVGANALVRALEQLT
jgi:beta-ureidopropionase / N-carbamoyl-L-amino-acid hydrolase